MRDFIVTVFLLGSITTVSAQFKDMVVIGKVDSLESKILQEQRKILVYNPGLNTNASFQESKYPVIYVLDGEAHFNSIVGMVEQLSNNNVIPQMMVVGVTNTNRMRDLTPTKSKPKLPFMPAEEAAQTGGGENLLAFFESELFPYIESKYPTAPYRIMIGHSLGGLMVLHTLVNHQHLFNSYVAIDPSMWYDDQKLLKQVADSFKNDSYAGTSLYVGMANTLEPSMDINTVGTDTSESSSHIRSIMELNKYLDDNKQNNLKSAWKYYPDDTHNSAPLIVEYDALRFFFKDFVLKMQMSDYTDPKADLSLLFTKHYNNLSGQLGYKISPPEDYINNFGYNMLGLKQYDKAEQLFKLNTVNYPESSNVFDSLGDLYVAKGNKAKAIEAFQKALSLKEVPDTRTKLNELLNKK